MKKIELLIAVCLLVFCSCSCKGTNDEKQTVPVTPDPPVETVYDAYTWTTTFDKSRFFQKSGITFGKASTMSPFAVRLTSDEYQSIDGFGLAVTQASCYNLLKMSVEDRTKLLKELFSPTEGAGSSLIRVCIGGSDFSMTEYTWCDTEGISNFKIHESEYEYLFPILDLIYEINPDVKIIGSPWSCPRWMKMDLQGNGNSYNSWTSGRLNPKYYGDYATYFVKWIQAMEERGYKILAVTLQNEPLARGNSMSLYMPWQDQAAFLKVVGPKFAAAGLQTKILVYDHNYNYGNTTSQSEYPLKIFNDAEADKYAAGSAWHNYGGNVSELDNIHKSRPDKEIYFTEASIGEWNYGQEGNGFSALFEEDFRDIFLGTLSRYGKGVTLWNLMLDDAGKPYRPGGCSTCYGAVSVGNGSWSYSSLDRKSHWMDVLHASIAVKPGAVRIGTDGFTKKNLTYLAFRNPDSSYGVLILNSTSDAQQLVFVTDAHSVPVTVPGKSVVSLKWKD